VLVEKYIEELKKSSGC